MAKRDEWFSKFTEAITSINVLIAQKDARIAMLEAMLDDSIDGELALRDELSDREKSPVL